MSAAALQEFRLRLTCDDDRRAILRAAGERGAFFEEALRLAQEWELDLTIDDLKTADREGHRRWTERFI
ncbi:MAG TPA: hypothetical protein VHM91_05170 [Verrucomicrobiales bacterium]|nr:hypothetical protein [Verrucomicrobiales bacterium]